LAILGAGFYFQPSLCPQETIAAGHLVGLSMMIGLWGAVIGVFVAAQAHFEHGSTGPSPGSRRATVRLMGLATATLSLPLWADGFLTYYCAAPSSIAVHHGFTAPVTGYEWNDVNRVDAGCIHAKSTTIFFDLRMRDGQKISLGGDAWSRNSVNYLRIGHALSNAPFKYYNAHSVDCPPDLRALFSAKPS